MDERALRAELLGFALCVGDGELGVGAVLERARKYRAYLERGSIEALRLAVSPHKPAGDVLGDAWAYDTFIQGA
jgi:hypothetical protein